MVIRESCLYPHQSWGLACAADHHNSHVPQLSFGLELGKWIDFSFRTRVISYPKRVSVSVLTSTAHWQICWNLGENTTFPAACTAQGVTGSQQDSRVAFRDAPSQVTLNKHVLQTNDGERRVAKRSHGVTSSFLRDAYHWASGGGWPHNQTKCCSLLLSCNLPKSNLE